MNEGIFTRGDAQAAVDVMIEAAQWLESRGMPLWTAEELRRLPEQYPPDAFLTLYAEGKPAAAALLIFADPLLWPEAGPGTSGFLHKISVRRTYAGQGLALRLIEYAAHICKNTGMQFLRLDCDAARGKLVRLYLSAGFARAGTREISTKTHGEVTAALFERTL